MRGVAARENDLSPRRAIESTSAATGVVDEPRRGAISASRSATRRDALSSSSFSMHINHTGPLRPGRSSASRDHGHSSNWGISKSATQQTENPVVALPAGKSCQREPPARLRVAFPVDAPAKSVPLHTPAGSALIISALRARILR